LTVCNFIHNAVQVELPQALKHIGSRQSYGKVIVQTGGNRGTTAKL
jgi:hypothetical protein